MKKIATVLLIGFIVFPFWYGPLNIIKGNASKAKSTASFLIKSGDVALQGATIGSGIKSKAVQAALSGASIGIVKK